METTTSVTREEAEQFIVKFSGVKDTLSKGERAWFEKQLVTEFGEREYTDEAIEVFQERWPKMWHAFEEGR